MTLTVPKAGSDGGRAARVRVEEPQGGALLAQFGDQMRAVGEALENDYLSREAQRFQTDLTGEMNNLRLEVMEIGDPDQAEAAWRQGSQALRQSYLEGQTDDGRPRVSPKNAEKFGLTFDELHNRNAFSLGKQTLGARQAQQEATFIRYAQTATQQGATADPDMRATLLGQGYEQVDQMVAAGVIDAAEGERRKLGLTQDMDNARAIEMVASDPDGFLASSGDGDFAGLPADVRARYRVQAQGNINRLAAKAEAEAERVAKEQAKVRDGRLKDMRAVWDAGMQSDDIAYLLDEDAKQSPEWAETMAQFELVNEYPRLRQMTPAQQEALIAGEKARPVTKGYEAQRLPVLEKLRSEAETAWATDGVAYARETGLYVPDLPEFDPKNPAAYASGLAARVKRGDEFVEEGRTNVPPILDAEERAQLVKLSSVDTPPETRLALAKALGASMPARGPNTITEITGDPVLAHVSGYLAAGGRDDLASQIFEGQADIVNGNVTMPSKPARIEAGIDMLSGVFSGFGGSARAERAAREATDALYAKKARVAGQIEDIDTDLYVQSMHEVMGGLGASGSEEARGGIAVINGYATMIPVGMRHQDVLTTIDKLGDPDPEDMERWERTDDFDPTEFARSLDETIQRSRGDVPSGPDKRRLTLNDQLTTASVTGKPPLLEGKPMITVDFRNARLQPLGGDNYRLVYDTALGTREIKDADGDRYVLNLRKLVAEVTR